MLFRCFSFSLFSLSDWYAVSDTSSHEVLVFSDVGTLVKRFGSPGPLDENINSPTDITFLSNGDLVVIDPLQGKVKVFEAETGRFLRHLAPSVNFKRPSGVTATVNDYVIISDSETGLITVINPQGQLRNQFDLGDPEAKPRHVAITRERTIVITDVASSGIHFYSFSGKKIQAIEAAQLRLLDEPDVVLSGLCVDEDDNILVIVNNSVCLLLLPGEHLLWRLLGPDDDLLEPRCLGSSGDGELLVGDHATKAVWIFRHDIQQYRTFRQFQNAAKERRCTL